MATVTTNMLDLYRFASFEASAMAALSNVAAFFEDDLQSLVTELDTGLAPIETVTNTKITLDFSMGSQFYIEGANLNNLANGSLNAYTITRMHFSSAGGIALDLTGSVTFNPSSGTASGSLNSLDISSSWFTASIDISDSNIAEFESSFTFSNIEIRIPSMLNGGDALLLSLTGTMTADDMGLSGTVTGLTLVSADNSFVATGLTGDLATLANAESAEQFFSELLKSADTITGTNGNDHLSGYAGNDTLNGGLGRDELDGNNGNDVLNGDAGHDTLWGGLGNDTLKGGDDNDELRGEGGANKLFGDAGNDTLIGGPGSDTLNGGAGIDTLTYAYVTSPDATGVTVNLTNSTTAQNTVRAGYDLIVGIENVIGSNYKDILTGNALDNVLSGGNGADKLIGNGGNDKLYGGDGNDTLSGGDGNDHLWGGDNKDSMTGGAGSDTFYFTIGDALESAPGTNRDVITDFISGQDKINLRLIDANDLDDGNQAFSSNIASGAGFTTFSSLGIGRLYFDTQNKILYGNTDSDTSAEFSIQLTNVTSLSSADFVL